MKVTQDAGNIIHKSSDFQNVPGDRTPEPPCSVRPSLLANFCLLNLIKVRLWPYNKTVSRKKVTATVTDNTKKSDLCSCRLGDIGLPKQVTSQHGYPHGRPIATF